MTFSELQPRMGATSLEGYEGCNQLTFDCPTCGGRVQIYCRLDGPPDEVLRIWEWSYEEGRYDWNAISIKPSIGNHPVAKGLPTCPAHFIVTGGTVTI